jgi:hypothetical protein
VPAKHRSLRWISGPFASTDAPNCRRTNDLVYPASHGSRPARKDERRVPPALGGRTRAPRRGQPCLVRTKTVRTIDEPACDSSSVAMARHTGSSITSGPAENVKHHESPAEMPPRSIAATETSTLSQPSVSTATTPIGAGGDPTSVRIIPTTISSRWVRPPTDALIWLIRDALAMEREHRCGPPTGGLADVRALRA